MQHELVDKPFEQNAGYVELPEGPGLGITINEDVVRKYLYS
jgi:L-alanine-DL-glutamate epimerase-like enolase superfamily enzyme